MSTEAAWRRLSTQDNTEQPYWIARDFPALNLIQGQPKRALDVGCSAGFAGEALRKKYPDCRVWGVEPNALAANHARSRIQHVVESDFDIIDWSAQGIGDGFDVVLLLDVLEHMYNPWRTMQRIRTLLSPNAEVIVGLPNVRNLALMDDMANGFWHYRASGLLDVTHIRFFTEFEATKMFYQTGFRRTGWFSFVDANWEHWQHVTEFPFWIERDRMKLRADSIAELQQLATISNVTRLVPCQMEALNADELQLASDDHPHTTAAT
jgi:2-polyprenyl-3-methyl-5-hydroxy-6-metoxy-1,4-benzoquinol methylase